MSMSIAPDSLRSLPCARTARRTAIVGAASAAAVLLFAGPALAHITVSPDSAPAGGAAELTFRVPNEEAKAYTVKVDVQIPTDHPIAQLLVKPVVGWTATVKTITLKKPVTTDDGTFNQAVSEVIWAGGKILPGQFQDFSVSADPLPTGVGQMTFKAIQTYSNGDIVRWIDVSQPGQPAPDHPAPVLTLTTSKAPATTSTAHTNTASTTSGSGSDGLFRVLTVAALVVGLLACLLALMGGRRGRRATAETGLRPDNTSASERVAPDGDGVLAGTKASTKASGKRPTSRRRG
jgi:periplasmic copper chaperone A